MRSITFIILITGDSAPLVTMFSSLTSDDRKEYVLSDLNEIESDVRVVLCTSSLSVGVSLCKIECIVHYGIPTATNAFMQETGRAGREVGSASTSVVIGFPRMLSGRRTSAPMRNFVTTQGCRRAVLLASYDTAKDPRQENCCDNCGATRPAYLTGLVDARIDYSDYSSLTTSSSASIGDLLLDTDSEYDSDDLGAL